MTTPILINNFNRLSSTRRMVKKLLTFADAHVVIVDNASTYPPLLEWYSQSPVEVRRFDNLGCLAPWISKTVDVVEKLGPFYVVTDSDLDIDSLPDDTLEELVGGLRDNPDVKKVGLGLETRDLPDDLPLSEQIRKWEAQFWSKRRGKYWIADVDTTFAAYRSGERYAGACNGLGLRTNRPYVARHLPWYVPVDTQDPEEVFFRQHANLKMSTLTRCLLTGKYLQCASR